MKKVYNLEIKSSNKNILISEQLVNLNTNCYVSSASKEKIETLQEIYGGEIKESAKYE